MSEFKIVYAIDDNVYKLAAVSMASVLLNNINSDIEIIILQSSLCQEAFAEFNKLKKIKEGFYQYFANIFLSWSKTIFNMS